MRTCFLALLVAIVFLPVASCTFDEGMKNIDLRDTTDTAINNICPSKGRIPDAASDTPGDMQDKGSKADGVLRTVREMPLPKMTPTIVPRIALMTVREMQLPKMTLTIVPRIAR